MRGHAKDIFVSVDGRGQSQGSRQEKADATHEHAEILETGSSESIARTKRLLLDTLGRPLAEALDVAAEVNALARGTADCKRGIATFLETKKAPRWRD